MNLSVNGQSQVPPGFRFHPTEEELLHYYLRKKVACQKIDLDVIRDVDLNRLEPWDIQEKCKIGSTPQNDWYFFSHKDKKYPTGTRTNRATAAGFWKATGRDKFIYSNCIRIGMRKTLVFYRGRAPNGRKSDWIMHEYRLDDSNVLDNSSTHRSNIGGADQAGGEEGWVVCRVFKKKNYHHSKASISPQLGSENSANNILDQILMYMGTSSSNNNNNRSENKSNNNHCSPEFPSPPTAPAFPHLPGLESPSANTISTDQARSLKSPGDEQLIADQIRPPSDWAALDRLVASQLNEHHNYPKHFSGMIGSSNIGDQLDMDSFTFGDDASINHHQIISSSQTNFWSFARSTSSSSSDPVLSQLSV